VARVDHNPAIRRSAWHTRNHFTAPGSHIAGPAHLRLMFATGARTNRNPPHPTATGRIQDLPNINSLILKEKNGFV